VIQIDLEEGQKRLVIEGRIEKIKEKNIGYQSITLSTTSNYFSNSQTPRVSGAAVSVTDDSGNIYPFQESSSTAGLYETNSLFAEIGSTYTLLITYNGEQYRGSSTILPVAPIDSIYQEFKPETLFDEEGIRIKIDFSDPAVSGNYYKWQQFQDGVSLIDLNPGTKWTLISPDEFFNGLQVIGKEPNDEMIYETGQKALVRQLSISKSEYDYMFLLYDQATGGGPFDAPPATIRGNMENITNPENYPLGYFGASEVAEAELLIQ
jgi:hypothetical protein